MKRRSPSSRNPVKARRTTKSRHGNATKSPRDRRRALSRDAELARLTHERNEALEQFSAASEVLKVISSSPGHLKPVFEAILENATRICDAKFGTLWLREGDGVRAAALHGAPPAWADKFGSLFALAPMHR